MVRIYLIGVGVVGHEIVKAHVAAKLPICVVDQSEAALRDTTHQLGLSANQIRYTSLDDGCLPAVEIAGSNETAGPTIVIESIAEKLSVKQAFYEQAERVFGNQAILCSNTSTLRIDHLAANLAQPNRFVGFHFFMPVDHRHAVEIVRGRLTDDETIHQCLEHANLIAKAPIVVADGPGFVVNRLLAPYLNQAMLMLERGIAADQIERAALRFGMPMSPLELSDWIGTRTMFDAGRAYWQAFPGRFDPSPILPAMVKAKRFGRSSGVGFYDYQNGDRSSDLSPITTEICDRYRREAVTLTDAEVMQLLSIPMWIEAALTCQGGVVDECSQIDLAMRGGLAYRSDTSFLQFFKSLGSDQIASSVDRWANDFKSMDAPLELRQAVQQTDPRSAIERLTAASNAC